MEVRTRFGPQVYDPPYELKEALWWLTENEPPKTPRSVNDPGVRERIVLAWKLDRARKLAEKDAQQLADEITNKVRSDKWTVADVQKLVRERKAKVAGSDEPFELDNVARMTPSLRVHQQPEDGATEYRTYKAPPYQAWRMPYEVEGLVEHLLVLRQPGRATVIPDGVQKTFYVTVLLARTEPDMKEFLDAYAGGAKKRQSDPLYNDFVHERTQEYRAAVMRQLREDAGKVNKHGRFEIPEEFRKRETHEAE